MSWRLFDHLILGPGLGSDVWMLESQGNGHSGRSTSCSVVADE
jgi:hypothetical protein